MKVVAGLDIERGYAFRPSALEKEGIKVEFRRTPTTKFHWPTLRSRPAVHITEVWIEEDGTEFEPGNSFTQFLPID